MGMSVGKAGGRVRPEMNVTPLVDVVLVLLIIFMVVTPLLTKKFWLHVPKTPDEASASPPAPSHDVVLRYAADDTIRINRDVVSRAELPARLRRALAARTDGLVFFDADDEADYGRALAVMDLARGAGATTIAIAPEPLPR